MVSHRDPHWFKNLPDWEKAREREAAKERNARRHRQAAEEQARFDAAFREIINEVLDRLMPETRKPTP